MGTIGSNCSTLVYVSPNVITLVNMGPNESKLVQMHLGNSTSFRAITELNFEISIRSKTEPSSAWITYFL